METNNPMKIRDQMSKKIKNYDFSKGSLFVLAGPGTGKSYNLVQIIQNFCTKKAISMMIFSKQH